MPPVGRLFCRWSACHRLRRVSDLQSAPGAASIRDGRAFLLNNWKAPCSDLRTTHRSFSGIPTSEPGRCLGSPSGRPTAQRRLYPKEGWALAVRTMRPPVTLLHSSSVPAAQQDEQLVSQEGRDSMAPRSYTRRNLYLHSIVSGY